jgi:hypothetical protein
VRDSISSWLRGSIDDLQEHTMSLSRKRSTGLNPGKAGPKGALGLPAATKKRPSRDEDQNVQRSFVKLTQRERRRTRRDGNN